MNSGIYTITNNMNGHRYVGSAVDLKDRFRCHRQHLNKETHGNTYLQRAWNKYGENAFKFEILECWEPELLISMEQWWMNMLCPEYNIAPVAGNSLGVKHSKKTRANMSIAHMGHRNNLGYKHTAETRANMSAAHMGNKPSNETRAKMSVAQKSRKRPPCSKETRAKISAALKGRKRKPLSEEHKANVSMARMGHKASEETRAKISAAMKGKPWSPARREAQEAKCSL